MDVSPTPTSIPSCFPMGGPSIGRLALNSDNSAKQTDLDELQRFVHLVQSDPEFLERFRQEGATALSELDMGSALRETVTANTPAKLLNLVHSQLARRGCDDTCGVTCTVTCSGEYTMSCGGTCASTCPLTAISAPRLNRR
jgi:hypothetical protein